MTSDTGRQESYGIEFPNDGVRLAIVSAMAARHRSTTTLMALAFFVIYAIYALSRWRQYLTAGYDLGIFDQAVHHYAHFQAPLVPLKGDRYNILGDHFHPILAVLSPLYWIWDDPRMLLLAQAALVASSIPVVAGLFRRHLGYGRLPILLTLCYALSWPIQRMVDFDFHEIAFGVPLLAVALDGLDRRDDRRLVVAGLLLLLVREDMGMILAMLGLVRLLRGARTTELDGEAPLRGAENNEGPCQHDVDKALRCGAGDGNRTRVSSLGSWRSTIELRPHAVRRGPV